MQRRPFADDPELARLAGQRSGEARREKRDKLPTVRELFGDHVEAVAEQLLNLALRGDRQACEFILTMTHGKPKQAVDVEAKQAENSALREMVEYFSGVEPNEREGLPGERVAR